MFRNNLKTAWRSIRNQKAISLINVTGLATGMVAAILIFLWVQNELNFDSYHKDAANIYRVTSIVNVTRKDPMTWETSPFILGEKMKERIPEVVQLSRVRRIGKTYFNIKGEFSPEEAGAYVDDEWFSMFSNDFISGNANAFNSKPQSMLLTASLAKKYFGNQDPIGKSIRIDSIDYEIQGILKDYPSNSSFRYDFYLPLAIQHLNPQRKANDLQWGNYNYITFFKLRPNTDTSIAGKKIRAILAKEREGVATGAAVIALKDLHFNNGDTNSGIIHGDRKMVSIFNVLGILLLAIACINYVNLTTARATIRVKEVSIKKIVGAQRKDLFVQFIMESALVSLFALALSLLALQLCLPAFNRFTEKNFVLSPTSMYLWLILGGTFLASVILTSVYPAILLSSFKPLSIFRGTTVFRTRDGWLRKALVVVQFSISIILITGTIVIYRQMQFINKQNSTYEKSQMFSFSIPYTAVRNWDEEKRMSTTQSLKQDLLSHSNIAMAGLMNMGSVVNMTGYSSGSSNDWDGRPKDFVPAIAFFHADSSLKSMLNLEMSAGRWFHPTGDEHNSILNETAVREFNIKEPVIGQRFTSQGDTGIVIGVVKDFIYKSMHEKIGPAVLRNDDDYCLTYLIKTMPGRTMEARNDAEASWKKFFPSEPFNYSFLNEEFEKLYRADRKAASLIWLFSCLAIFISCMGLYGLAAFTAERRAREIGIRKVLGASAPGIVSLLSKDFLRLIVVALFIATPLAWILADKWLQDFAYRINVGWWMFIAAGGIALLVAFISIGLRAVKAAMSNPVHSLRTE